MHSSSLKNIALSSAKSRTVINSHCQQNNEQALNLDTLIEARRIAALVVKHYGDKYLPIFDKLDRAILAKQSAAHRINRALNGSTSNPDALHQTAQIHADQKDGQFS